MRRSAWGALLALSTATVGSVVVVAGPAAAATGQTTRVSVSSTEKQQAGGSSQFAISGDGRYVLFGSSAANLVAGDTNGVTDIFVRDRLAGTTRRVSVPSAGGQADGESWSPSISADGRYAVFVSSATNLVRGDTNGLSDIFLRDLRTGAVRRVVTAAGDDLFNAEISADGRSVVFSTTTGLTPGDTNATEDVYVNDLATGVSSLISTPSGSAAPGDDSSFYPSISATGRYVAFVSFATNLVPGDTNNVRDIFLRDRTTGTTTRVSLSDDEQQATVDSSNGPSVSADGRLVTFWSEDPGMVPGDTNGQSDIFVRDVRAGTTSLISVTPAGAPGNGNSSDPQITPDGRSVVFGSWSSDLVAGDTNEWFDIFVRDLRTGTTSLVSVSSTGEQGTYGGDNGGISADGRHVVFDSGSPNLVPGDTNDAEDTFVRDR